VFFRNPEWEDYVLELRIKIVEYNKTKDSPIVSVIYRDNYMITLNLYWGVVNFASYPPLTSIIGKRDQLKKDTWYTGMPKSEYTQPCLPIISYCTRDQI